MSNDEDDKKIVENRLLGLYRELEELNRTNYKIMSNALVFFTPESQAKAKQELGDTPKKIESLKESIRNIEEKHQMQTRLDSPSSWEKYLKK